jgi:uncharacterized Zn-finger protein
MEEIDHEYTDEIICPYCGEDVMDSWEYSDSGDIQCGKCRKEFTYEREVTVTYSTQKSE